MQTTPRTSLRQHAARVLPALWVAGALLCVGLAAWILTTVPDPATRHRADWRTAVQRMERRIGAGEMVLIHRAGLVWEAGDPVAGLPVACDPRSKGVRIDAGRPGAVWVVGEEKHLDRDLRRLLKKFRQQGTIRYGNVHLRHAWDRASTAKEGRR